MYRYFIRRTLLVDLKTIIKAALPIESSTVMLVGGTDPSSSLGGELPESEQETAFDANFGVLAQPQILVCV